MATVGVRLEMKVGGCESRFTLRVEGDAFEGAVVQVFACLPAQPTAPFEQAARTHGARLAVAVGTRFDRGDASLARSK